MYYITDYILPLTPYEEIRLLLTRVVGYISYGLICLERQLINITVVYQEQEPSTRYIGY
jgi:hypothetical protein